MRTKKDMYLPNAVCGLGIFFLACGVACAVASFIYSLYLLIGVVFCLALGVAAVLCWKNQWVQMLNDSEFIYSTMFGTKIKYRFSEITDIKQNIDSMTLILESGKVHIESCAIISDKFADKINGTLNLK